MRVSFDSNAWEEVFRSDAPHCIAIREALVLRRIEGFICETAFRIEAVRKKERTAYFAKPQIEAHFPFRIIQRDGESLIHLMSLGPDDQRHPGLPERQAAGLKLATAAGIRLMRGLAWMGLPSPKEIRDPILFPQESEAERSEREQRQIAVDAAICERHVGRQAFQTAGGWQALDQAKLHETKFSKACAEWADGEFVAAHIAYRNDLLCTEDRGIAAGKSIFDASNRAWLTSEYGVRFVNLEELATMVSV